MSLSTVIYIILALLLVVCGIMTMLNIKQKAKVEVLEKNEQKYIEDFKEKESKLS